jgi:hypothetical protein
MLVMFDVTGPVGGANAMTGKQGTTGVIDVKALLEGDGDYLRAMVRAVVDATLEAEMTAALGAEKGERSAGRLCYGQAPSRQVQRPVPHQLAHLPQEDRVPLQHPRPEPQQNPPQILQNQPAQALSWNRPIIQGHLQTSRLLVSVLRRPRGSLGFCSRPRAIPPAAPR